MKLKSIVLATLLATASSAHAGNFVNLTSGVGGQLTVANGGLINGANNSNADPLYIETVSATYLAGFDQSNADGEVVAQTLNYRTFTGSTTTGTGTLTLLDWQVTRDVDLAAGSKQFDYFDFVYRDSADNKLVFGTRALNRVDNNEEINFLYRGGFAGYSTASAWTFSTDVDLRQYQAGLTSDNSYNASVAFDDNVVRQKSDVSLSEGNPWSGLFLVKTDAPDYVLGTNAIGFFQAGEEGQAKVGGFIGGYVAAAVPEPETYAMLLAGLGIVGLAARRRNAK